MNKYKLEYEIKSNGFTIDGFCKAINLSKSAYYRKCNGESEFTQSEMQRIMVTLKLKSPMGIFFEEEVS